MLPLSLDLAAALLVATRFPCLMAGSPVVIGQVDDKAMMLFSSPGKNQWNGALAACRRLRSASQQIMEEDTRGGFAN